MLLKSEAGMARTTEASIFRNVKPVSVQGNSGFKN